MIHISPVLMPARVPTDDRKICLVGFVILLVALGGFGVWAATAELDSAVVAPGVVTVKSYRKTIQHLQGGIVKEILVQDGDFVHAGDILLRLDDTQACASLEIVRSQYLAARALEARLRAESDQRAGITFPKELLLQRDDPRVKSTLDGQDRVFAARRDARESQVFVLNQRVKQLRAQIEGLNVLQQTEQQRIVSMQEEANDFRKLLKRGHTDKNRLRELERAIAELQGQQAKHLSEIAMTQVKIGETQLQTVQLGQQFHSDVVTELREVQTEIFDLEERMRALEDTLLRTEIRAPRSGTVVGLAVHTVEGVIKPGTPILDIVPEGETLVVEAHIQPTDIDNVHAGLVADARFTAFQARITPVVEARVIRVSADRLLSPNDQAPYFLARIEVTAKGMERLQNLKLLPGMPAEVLIKTGERTLLEYLLRPLLDAFTRSFKEV